MNILMGVFFVGFLIQSIFGFGGTVLAIALFGRFGDVALLKEAILIAMVVAPLANIAVIGTDYSSFSWKQFRKIFLPAIPGVILGTYLLAVVDIQLLITIFGIFLVVYALKSLLSPGFRLSQTWSQIVLVFSGLAQGLIGAGGPFAVMAMNKRFDSPAQMRVTLAGYYVALNVLRMMQTQVQGTFTVYDIVSYWRIIIIVTIAVLLGYMIHVKTSEKIFEFGVPILLLIAGMKLLLF